MDFMLEERMTVIEILNRRKEINWDFYMIDNIVIKGERRDILYDND